jgi:hypothetical protein
MMIIIIGNPLLISIALNLEHILLHLGHKVFTKLDITDYDCDNDDFFYIVIVNDTDRNPKKYVQYQIEQSTSNWFTPRYMLAMKNSHRVWEFSISNYNRYKNAIDRNHVYQMPMPFYRYRKDILDNPIPSDFEYDITFYGSINTRRSYILDKLKKKYKVNACINVYGENAYEIIKKSKIILNIHFYKEATLESARFNEVLQFNRLIVSERSIQEDQYNMDLYKDIVVFVDTIKEDHSNINQLYEAFDKWLYNDAYIKKIEDNSENLKTLQEKCTHLVKDYFDFDFDSDSCQT